MAKAKEYSTPEKSSTQTKYGQQKTNRKNSKKKSKKKPKNKNNRNTSNSSNQKRRTGKFNEIRSEFIENFGQYLQQQRERGYQIGWIWYSLLDQFVPTAKEIVGCALFLDYPSGGLFASTE